MMTEFLALWRVRCVAKFAEQRVDWFSLLQLCRFTTGMLIDADCVRRLPSVFAKCVQLSFLCLQLIAMM